MASSYEAYELLERIEYLRKYLIEVASQNGYTSDESIQVSQELDKLLNVYQKLTTSEDVHRIRKKSRSNEQRGVC
ncbi:MAG: aspartyl-phosphate phosphatase Spo0E family protein [Bacillaceae bacterium]|nr:aspartyl-phosphate phosphatase Spo0E family protein [Bacillaceae bacterium]